jgi:ankyrin repeat protein
VKNNIFTAIDKDDYKAFVKCFAGNGVDMKKERCNGYSPLTYAVSQGNNLMVKFFIQHGAKLTAKDSNGCNAFETAVKFHYQDICEMLLAADDSLPSKCGDLKELYNQNSFINYINDKQK